MRTKNHLQYMYSWTGFAAQNNSVRILGLTVESAWATWAAVIATFVFYLLSSYPDLSVWDSSLIALAAIQGGLGHPPGYPLHTMLGALMAQLPVVAPLTGVKLLSAIPGALMCVPILCLASQLRSQVSPGTSPRGAWLAAVMIFLLCIHPVLWDPATRVEVYSLAAFLSTWGVARIATALQERTADSDLQKKSPPKGFFVAGLALGASASVNPVVAATTTTAAFVAVFKTAFRFETGWRTILLLVAGGIVGLLPYAWLPMVAGRTDRFIWGAPIDTNSLWNFLSARDFATNVGPDPATLGSHLFDWVGWSTLTGTILFITIGMIGWILLGKRSPLGRTVPVALALVIFALINNKVWIPENPDYLGYLCGPLAICFAGGVGFLNHLSASKDMRYRFVLWSCILTIVTVSLIAPTPLFSRARHMDRTARIIAQGAFAETPQGGIVVLNSDHWFWPMLYMQEIEKIRTDVVLIPIGLANTDWYWKYLNRLHPTLHPFSKNVKRDKYRRVESFLEANSDRHVSVENAKAALLIGSKFSDVGWLLLEDPIPDHKNDEINAAIEQAAALIQDGSPDGAGTLSLVSYMRGEGLWRLGRPLDAYRSLLAGVPLSMRPARHMAAEQRDTVPEARPLFPPNASIRGLGDPHLNLQMAEFLLTNIQDPKTIETK